MTTAEAWPSLELARPKHGALPEGWLPPSRGVLINYERSRRLGMVPTHARILQRPALVIPRDEIATGHTKEVVETLRRAADLEREAGRKLVGLAANQMDLVGAIAIADLTTGGPDTRLGELMPLINPRFVPDVTKGWDIKPEGCFSCGPVFCRVRRPLAGVLTAYDVRGRELEVPCAGYTPRVVEHELDHLEGRLAPDLAWAQGYSRDWRYPELSAHYATSIEQGQVWPYSCSQEQWTALCLGSYRLEDFELAA